MVFPNSLMRQSPPPPPADSTTIFVVLLPDPPPPPLIAARCCPASEGSADDDEVPQVRWRRGRRRRRRDRPCRAVLWLPAMGRRGAGIRGAGVGATARGAEPQAPLVASGVRFLIRLLARVAVAPQSPSPPSTVATHLAPSHWPLSQVAACPFCRYASPNPDFPNDRTHSNSRSIRGPHHVNISALL